MRIILDKDNLAEWIGVLVITFFCIFILSLGFIVDWMRTPPGSIYLGTIHYPSDYFNYISWIVQGKENILSSTLLYTSSSEPYNLSRWEFVLLGFIFLPFGIPSFFIYHIGVFLFRISFFVSGYLVIRVLLPSSRIKRLIAFFFFATSTAWPIIQWGDKGIEPGYHFFWYNTGNFFSRFGPTPNHLLGSTFLALILYFLFYLFRDLPQMVWRKRIFFCLMLFMSSFALSGISPVHWVLVTGVTAATIISYPVILSLKNHNLSLADITKTGKVLFISFIFLLSGGILPAIYIRIIYSQLPYTLVTSWEATQRLPMDPSSFFFANGVVVLFAIFGIIPFIRRVSSERIFVILFVSLGLILYMSTIHLSLGIMNVRFWPQAVYVLIGVLSSEGVFFMSSFFRKTKEAVLVLLILVYSLTTMITDVSQLKEQLQPKVGDGFVYLPLEAYNIYSFAEKNTPSDAVFLTQWPYNQSFPAITGKKVFYGDPISNISVDAHAKSQFSIQFIDGVLSEREALLRLRTYGITHILAFKGLGFEKYSILRKIYETQNAGVYEVML